MTFRFPDLTIDIGRHTVTVRGQDVEVWLG